MAVAGYFIRHDVTRELAAPSLRSARDEAGTARYVPNAARMKRIIFIAAVAAIPTASFAKTAPKTITLKDGLKYVDLVVGKGDMPKKGQTVRVHYVGTLVDGTKFDSSRDRGQPFEFALGTGGVIAGWDEGVAGMRVGGRRKLTVPPTLGYGAQGAGDKIPPNATLIFDIELLGIS
jgi:peptidylprolyl isomerase